MSAIPKLGVYNPYFLVEEFVAKFKRPVGFTTDNVILSDALITEEYNEVFDEFDRAIDFNPAWNPENIDKVKLTEELADLQYVINYAAVTLELPLYEVFEEKHRANMTKLDDNGEPILRKDGKILKGPNYQKPDYSKFF